MMQKAHQYLKKVRGLQFYKLMGSGKGLGFNPFPDWSTYAIIMVWENDDLADEFMQEGSLFQLYEQLATEHWTIFMKNISSHGDWSGGNPFHPSDQLKSGQLPVAIITRATIKWSKLYHFWKYVPTSQKPIHKLPGLIYTKGIGEAPIVQMATFSIWKDLEAVKSYAYRSKEHQEAIRLTRKLQWYKEELFARFQPYRSTGSWKGSNPLLSFLDAE